MSRLTGFPTKRRRSPILLSAAALLMLPGGGGEPAYAKGLKEEILESRYDRGDYAFFIGWHDPWDWQFDEQGSYAWPVGLKVRVRLTDRFRAEGDFSYYRTSSETILTVSRFSAPQFDGLVMNMTLQGLLRTDGLIRPYVGGGVVFVSLANDFVVVRPDVRAADPGNPDQRTIAKWSQFDVGVQGVVGCDFMLLSRAFPFVEFRYISGELGIDDSDVKIGQFSLPSLELTFEELETVPEDGGFDSRGRNYEHGYDWSGPIVMVGLKIRF
jgi:hypothetical protein